MKFLTLFVIIALALLVFKFLYRIISRSFNKYAHYASLGFGMPILRRFEDYFTPKPASVGLSDNLYMLLRKAIRRLYKTRTLYFKKIWLNPMYSLGFKLFLTSMLIESSLDLLFILARLTVYYLVSFNTVSILLTPFTCVLLIGLLDQARNVVPLLLWWSLIGYMLGEWLLCKAFPLYERWLYHNLRHVTLYRLAGISPGKDAWKILASMYMYILLRAFDDYLCSHFALLKTKQLYEASKGLHSFAELYKVFRDELTPFHIILEKKTVEAFTWLMTEIKQLIVFLFF